MSIETLSPALAGSTAAIKSGSFADLSKDQKAARATAEEFEHSFLTTMLKSMFEGVETSAPFGGGHAEKQFRSVLLGEYAKDMSKTGGIGIADEVYREILAIQEGRV